MITDFRPQAGGGTNAYLGCPDDGSNPNCTDQVFWSQDGGYGDEWNYALVLNMSGQDNSLGGTLEFDLRYDLECNYDYMYLEYFDQGTSSWTLMKDAWPAGDNAVFNGVSGNLSASSDTTQTGRDCGEDIYGHSDQRTVGGTQIEYYGNSQWLTAVSFPIPPAASGGIQVRWRGFSDGAWSDQTANRTDDTDGMGAIDNLMVMFGTGNSVSDDFNTPAVDPLDFSDGLTATVGTPAWEASGLVGSNYDAWHMTFDPEYKNKGNTCTFSNDWMWSGKPDNTNILGKGFEYFLVSPVIACEGWTGALVEFSSYLCLPEARNDVTYEQVRVYDETLGWGPWQVSAGWFGGCEFWNINDRDDFSEWLGPTVDSLQYGWSLLDTCKSNHFCWGRHLNSIVVVDNVSFGEFDGQATQFSGGGFSLFTDTFSRRDPAHTPWLRTSDEGMWPGRQLEANDSLNIEVKDFNGVTNGNVLIHWRVGSGTPPSYGAWSNKAMNLQSPDATSDSDEGQYATVIGNLGSEDYSADTPEIWDPGTTVEYYLTCLDDMSNLAYFPIGVDTGANPARFQVLPMGRELNAQGDNAVIVDDYRRNYTDFENSTGYNPTGGIGFGAFTTTVAEDPLDQIQESLALIYGGGRDDFMSSGGDPPKWDIYNVGGAGFSTRQHEPNILGNSTIGMGGMTDDLGNPAYDVIIWLNGSFDALTISDTTRINLKTYINNGGNLLSFGQDVARNLSSQGQGSGAADSAIQFLQEYLGTEYVQDETSTRIINITGASGTSLEGLIFGLYGECPDRSEGAYDQLELASNLPVGHTNEVLASYSDGSPADTGAAAIKLSIAGGGNGVQAAFSMGNFLSDDARACFLNAMLVGEFGLTDMSYTGCQNTGTGAPVVAAGGFGFDLAAAAPNPFVSSTSIKFSVPSRTHVSIEVYNILGQRVRTLVDEQLDADSYVREWDGRSDAGSQVSSGIYFYKMVAGDFSATKKAVLLK